jgi:tRNA U38,U39,U40 pseudouridine synthase TruA
MLDDDEDLDAMRIGAAAFVGEHDFRNFCKVQCGLSRALECRLLLKISGSA